VTAYIQNQVEHHKKRDYAGELLAFLRAHGVEFNGQYVFD